MQFPRVSLIAAALTAAMVAPVAGAVDKLTTDREKVSYMVGMDLANGIRQIKDDVDLAIVIQALQESVKDGGKPLLTQEEALSVRQAFVTRLQAAQAEKAKVAADENKAAGDKFLAANKGKPGVKVTASGLQYQVISEGKGAKPKPTDRVSVHYTGTLLDGTKFDSSVDRGQPAQFMLNGVIPGWTEGLQLMTVGSKYKFFIPSALGYGDRGTPGGPIGPNATLVFEVELLEILKPEAAPTAAPAPTDKK
jgi:FKBP-type peptidyl-prolyl cis-trans isomerase FkpA